VDPDAPAPLPLEAGNGMLTPVERVLILKGVDLLKDVGPRHLLGLANVAREVEIFDGDAIYEETDGADALYIVVEGRVRLSNDGRTMSEVGPGESFGTWSLVDDSARGHRAVCADTGRVLALNRDDFYDLAAADLTLLTELVRVLAKRLRALTAERPPEEQRVEGEGSEKPEALVEEDAAAQTPEAVPPTAGSALAAAALGKPSQSPTETGTPVAPDPSVAPGGVPLPKPIVSPPDEKPLP
jgi:Cyclic nucleotide-binding domain